MIESNQATDTGAGIADRGWLARHRTRIIAVAVVAVIGSGLALAALLSDRTTAPTFDEFHAALRSAIDAMAAFDGVEGIEEGYVDGQLASAVWFSSRDNGDAVVIQRQDLAVLGIGGTEGGIATTIHVRAGTTLYVAAATPGDQGSGWDVVEPDDGRVLAFGLALLSEYDDFGAPPEAHTVTRKALAGSNVRWSLTAPFSDGDLVVTWQSGSGGELLSYAFELVAVSPHNRPFPGLTSASIRFDPLDTPDPIIAPQPNAEPDTEKLGLPADFPFG